ncbi:MAG: MaoC/PaaZ C-terminal domain-containing protein [Acidimicrobiales bacterium]
MALSKSLEGAVTPSITHEIDQRWIAAYAAGIGDHGLQYVDGECPGGIRAHPIFPVCLEWPLVQEVSRIAMSAGLSPDEAMRGVHSTHSLRLHQPIRPGDVLTTSARVASVTEGRAGARLVIELETLDGVRRPVATTKMGVVFLGVTSDAAEGSSPSSPQGKPVELDVLRELRVPIEPTTAIVYTECARIWNPIHTDPVVARSAGLPGPILHGTASLAIAVSLVMEMAGPHRRMAAVDAEFAAMVVVPSEITVQVGQLQESEPGSVLARFEVRNARGERAIRGGLAGLIAVT